MLGKLPPPYAFSSIEKWELTPAQLVSRAFLQNLFSVRITGKKEVTTDNVSKWNQVLSGGKDGGRE